MSANLTKMPAMNVIHMEVLHIHNHSHTCQTQVCESAEEDDLARRQAIAKVDVHNIINMDRSTACCLGTHSNEHSLLCLSLFLHNLRDHEWGIAFTEKTDYRRICEVLFEYELACSLPSLIV